GARDPGTRPEQRGTLRDPRSQEREGGQENRGPRREASQDRRKLVTLSGALLPHRPGDPQRSPHPREHVARGDEDEDRGPDLEMDGLEERRRGGGAAEARDAQGVQGEDEGDAARGPG